MGRGSDSTGWMVLDHWRSSSSLGSENQASFTLERSKVRGNEGAQRQISEARLVNPKGAPQCPWNQIQAEFSELMRPGVPQILPASPTSHHILTPSPPPAPSTLTSFMFLRPANPFPPGVCEPVFLLPRTLFSSHLAWPSPSHHSGVSPMPAPLLLALLLMLPSPSATLSPITMFYFLLGT